MLRPYLELIKPGIVLGNLVSVSGGILLGARGDVDWRVAMLTAAGVSLVVASGCAVNSVVDRDIDGVMRRTCRRPMPTGRITVRAAMAIAALLGTAGVITLVLATARWLPVMLVLAGYVVYAGLYTLALKRGSVYGTLVGSIAGAMPPVAGYCATRGHFDATACVLLGTYSLWQMAHSYAIAIFRADDYRAAGIPVLPVLKGFGAARRHVVRYVAAFAIAAPLACLTGGANGWSGTLAFVAGLGWLWVACQRRAAVDDARWARRVFWSSILVVIALTAAMAVAAM